MTRTAPSVRVPFRCGAARGFRYDELPADVAERLPRWITERRVDGGVEIKPGRAYRFGPWMVKLSPPSRSLRDLLRASPAIRASDAHSRLAPIRTPRPLVALEWRTRGWLDGSLSVCEFVDGPSLAEVWQRDMRATHAFPAFMARMHRQRVFHGDFHPLNVIWSGTDWVLIDLDSIRHGLHALRWRAIVETQWARLLRGLGFDERLRSSFEAYLAEGAIPWPAESTWQRIVARARAMPPVGAS